MFCILSGVIYMTHSKVIQIYYSKLQLIIPGKVGFTPVGYNTVCEQRAPLNPKTKNQISLLIFIIQVVSMLGLF